MEREVQIPSGSATLEGELIIPEGANGVVLFAHGSGSSRHSPRNQFGAREIRRAEIGTLLLDLLTPDEEAVDIYTRRLRFDIDLLARRLIDATKWIRNQPDAADLGLGYFGASTGAAAALVAAAGIGSEIGAVVSRGDRPDLAGDALEQVTAPTLLIVGEYDDVVIELNEAAYARLRCEKQLKIIPRATHLFEEEGALEAVARLATDWFRKHLRKRVSVSAKRMGSRS